MDEKITTSAAENAENTAQAEQAAAPAQSSTQDGTATEAVTRPNRRLSRKPNLPEIQKQERLTAENQAAQNPPAKTTTLRRKTSRR